MKWVKVAKARKTHLGLCENCRGEIKISEPYFYSGQARRGKTGWRGQRRMRCSKPECALTTREREYTPHRLSRRIERWTLSSRDAAVRRFLSEACEDGPVSTHSWSTRDLYRHFVAWWEAAAMSTRMAMSPRMFTWTMRSLGFRVSIEADALISLGVRPKDQECRDVHGAYVR